MIIKFFDKTQENTLEIENVDDGVNFYVYTIGEEEIGRSITISKSEVKNVIKYLQEVQLYQ